MNAGLNRRGLCWPVILAFVLLLVTAFGTTCRSQSTDSGCAAALDQWGKIYQQLERDLAEFSTIQQTRAERIVQHPLFQPGAGKTIAKQISEALQAKENLLNAKRRECRELINVEDRAFSQLKDCLGNGKEARRDAKRLVRQRNSLLEKASVVLAEVKEVEGKETGMPYTEAMRGQQNYGRGMANSYWQNYQQMYRRWWGY